MIQETTYRLMLLSPGAVFWIGSAQLHSGRCYIPQSRRRDHCYPAQRRTATWPNRRDRRALDHILRIRLQEAATASFAPTRRRDR